MFDVFINFLCRVIGAFIIEEILILILKLLFSDLQHKIMIGVERLASTVIEFYATNSEENRRSLQNTLQWFREEEDAWRTTIELIGGSRPASVQFFGAEVLYHNISKNFNAIMEDIDNIELLKSFLLQKLSTCTHSLPHSVLNKLYSGLALFILKTMPDIWTNPLGDLMALWSTQLELLLRILAEIPTEFQRLNVSLDHRNRVREELRKATKEIVQLNKNAMEDPESPASLRNAASECMEAWIKLPGTSVHEFLPVFDAMFINNSNDLVALARTIGTLKATDDLPNFPQLVWQIVQAIVNIAFPLIRTELSTIIAEDGQNTGERMEELVPLVCTVVEFLHDFANIIVQRVCANLQDQPTLAVYLNICQMFHQISTLPGIYPIQECISELPEPWWYSLREELLQLNDNSPRTAANRAQLKADSARWFLEMLEAAIGKLAHNPEIQMDKEAVEKFHDYRITRCDVSLNAIQMAPAETIRVLSTNLHSALDAYNPERSEATIHLITEAIDFLKAHQMQQLIPAIAKCGTIQEWTGRVPVQRLIPFGRTFLHFVRSAEHLLLTHQETPETVQIVPIVVQIILSYLAVPELSREVLETLLTVMKKPENSVKVTVDPIIQHCYDYFNTTTNPNDCRLLAMRCIGMGLSFKDSATIIDSLNQILAPRLAELDRLATSVPVNGRMENINFELGVLAQLVATLETKCGEKKVVSPVKTILDQTLPLFNKLLTNCQPSPEFIGKICDVLSGGIQSLYTDIAPLLDSYLNFLDVIIQDHSGPACELAKRLFLTFHRQSSTETPILLSHLARWFSTRSSQLLTDHSVPFPTEFDEKLIELAHNILKKFWDCIEFSAWPNDPSSGNITTFVNSFCFLVSQIIERSRDTSLLQEALRAFNLLLKNYAKNENALLAECIFSEHIIAGCFMSIQGEVIMANSLNLIADILHFFGTKYPAQTRNIIQRLPGGDSQLVGAMFNEHTTRNYRLRVQQIHQAAKIRV